MDRGDIQEADRAMRRRQEQFRLAAEYVAAAFGRVGGVEKVALFGSVAVALPREVPRFREFRRAGIAIRHECKDADLAVWLADLGRLKALQRARTRALNDLLADRGIGVAHHQVDVFILDPGTDRYLGRLCCFGRCPKGKRECRAPGCGTTPLLQCIEGFTFRAAEVLAPGRAVTLYERVPA